MPPPGAHLSPEQLATKLLVAGPYKMERANRRVRVLLNGEWIVDTEKAYYVWEHPHFPFFYVPYSSLKADVEREMATVPGGDDSGASHTYWLGLMQVPGVTPPGVTPRTLEILGFETGQLAGLVKLPWAMMDGWYAEDEKLLGPHPKDPYKRIECLRSAREVRIEHKGVVLARCKDNIFLHETGLRTRYYLLPTSILHWNMFHKSTITTACPYKGIAQYYHLGTEDDDGPYVKDAVWYYDYPTAELSAVAGRVCFYNEKFNVFINGVLEEP